ncbi:unnamed protein product, partial [Amoebophrya sp. A120]|eukprot:GSA120T00010808001.1
MECASPHSGKQIGKYLQRFARVMRADPKAPILAPEGGKHPEALLLFSNILYRPPPGGSNVPALSDAVRTADVFRSNDENP